MQSSSKPEKKYKIQKCLYLCTAVHDRSFTKKFKDRLHSLLGISQAKFARYMYADIHNKEKCDTVSVAHMKMIVEQFNLVFPEEHQVSLEEMYHPDVVEESLSEYKSPIIAFFQPV